MNNETSAAIIWAIFALAGLPIVVLIGVLSIAQMIYFGIAKELSIKLAHRRSRRRFEAYIKAGIKNNQKSL